jgi:hypothetical protein
MVRGGEAERRTNCKDRLLGLDLALSNEWVGVWHELEKTERVVPAGASSSGVCEPGSAGVEERGRFLGTT